MKYVFLIAFALGSTVVLSTQIVGQEDLARMNDLPSKIGGPTCTNSVSGGNATVSGSLNVQGVPILDKPPTFSVSVYARGQYIKRQRVKNGGAFIFNCVPVQNVSLVAEVDFIEVGTMNLGTLFSPPTSNRADIVVLWQQVRPSQKEQLAVVSYRESYRRDSESRKLFEKSVSAIKEGKLDVARELLQKLLSRDPNDFVCWIELGNVQFNGGNYEEALVSYEKALKLVPEDRLALLGTGRAHLSLKHLVPAIEILTKADQIDDSSAEVNHYLGEAFMQNKQGSLAIVHMNKAIALAPEKKADLHLRMATLFHAAGARDRAAQEYILFLKKVPTYPDRPRMEQYIKENTQQTPN